MSDLIERPTDAADPTYPDAERCAQALEACDDDFLTEARFVRWQGREIERLTAALQYEQHRAGRQGTHGDGCADWGPAHYECAIRERDELRERLVRAEASVEEMCADSWQLRKTISRVEAERDELRRQLAEAGESIARQAATIRGLTRPAEE